MHLTRPRPHGEKAARRLSTTGRRAVMLTLRQTGRGRGGAEVRRCQSQEHLLYFLWLPNGSLLTFRVGTHGRAGHPHRLASIVPRMRRRTGSVPGEHGAAALWTW